MYHLSLSQSRPFPFMTHHWVCYKTSTTGATSGAGTDYISGATLGI
jgi:hypothetical protein